VFVRDLSRYKISRQLLLAIRKSPLSLTALAFKDRDERVIPITPSVRAIMDRRRVAADGSELPLTAYVFGNEIGEPVSRRVANEWWRVTCEKANVNDLMFHDLRREFGSSLKDLGVPIADVRDALGHSNITMTNHYLAGAESSVKKAYARLAQVRARKRIKVVGRA
jgi:integrase